MTRKKYLRIRRRYPHLKLPTHETGAWMLLLRLSPACSVADLMAAASARLLRRGPLEDLSAEL